MITDEFPIPTSNSQPIGITAGPDGTLWFVESNANKVGQITTAGMITEFPIPTELMADGILDIPVIVPVLIAAGLLFVFYWWLTKIEKAGRTN